MLHVYNSREKGRFPARLEAGTIELSTRRPRKAQENDSFSSRFGYLQNRDYLTEIRSGLPQGTARTAANKFSELRKLCKLVRRID